MGCVLLFLEQLLQRLLCREGRAVPSHIECTLPNFKMRTFAFVPKLRKFVWDLQKFRLSHVIRDFVVMPDLEVKSFWVHNTELGTMTLCLNTHIFFSLYPLKACKLWKGKIRCWKCDFVVTANPHYLLLAMVWGNILSFFNFLCFFAIFLPKATSSIPTWLKICFTKPHCSFFSVNYCCGVTEEASSEAGCTCQALCLALDSDACPSMYPNAPIRRVKMLCVSPAPQFTPAAPLPMRSPTGFSGTFVQVPMQDHGTSLLLLQRKKCQEMYGQDQLNTPLGCRGIFGLSGGAFPLMGSLRNPMWGMQKQSASFIAVEAHVWFEACQETKNSVTDAFGLVSQVSISSWWTLISFLALKYRRKSKNLGEVEF